MTIQDVFDRLRPISQAARQLLQETGYQPDDRRLSYDVRPLPDRYEDAFLRDNAEDILNQLADINRTLSYLEKPVHGEHTLKLLPDGRYGYYSNCGIVRVFNRGDRLEAKICNDYCRRRWVSTTIDHDKAGYCLSYLHIALDGLTIRERW